MVRHLACCTLLLSAACSGAGEITQTPQYQGGYEDGYNDGYEEAKTEYSAKIEDALAALSDARVQLYEADNAAERVASEADRFDYDDWQTVVFDVQAAAAAAVSETADVGRHLGEAESALSD